MRMQARNVPLSEVTTGELIAGIESAHHYTAIRFERKMFNVITNRGMNAILSRIIKVHHCSKDTARMLYSTSFGAYQMMGFNIWGILNINVSFIDFINDERLQDKAFQDFLLSKGIAYSPSDLCDQLNRRHFAKIYNGSFQYSKTIKKELEFLGFNCND